MNIQQLTLIALIVLLASCAEKKDRTAHSHDATSSQAEIQQDTIRKSVPKEAHAQIGDAHAMIKYHAPAVRGRMIWGGLVTLGEVWVTGAHSATSFEIDKNFIVNGKEIPAGKYAIFTIPGNDKWTVIVNKNWDQHLTDEYDQKEDVVRLDVTPETLLNIQERLRYAIVSQDERRGAIEISWEKVKVTLPFEIR